MTAGALLLLALGTAPVLPREGGPAAPAQVRWEGPGALAAELFRDAQACGACHPDAFAQWQSSAHAFSSFNNPVYRASIDRLRRERGLKESRACGGCHDVALLKDAAMDVDVAPEDPRAHAGIVCQVCHSAAHATRDGNGSLTLDTTKLLPEGEDAAAIAAHKRRARPAALESAELCGACHRSFLDGASGNASAFFGMDDYSPWLKSAYAGSHAERVDAPVPAADCRGCHMPRQSAPLKDVAAKKGQLASHRFAGAQTLLAGMRADLAQQQAVARQLAGAVSVDLALVSGGGPGDVRAGQALELDAVLFNERVGHRFPGGVMDNQGTRLEVELRTARGQLLAESRAHVLRSAVVDAQGQPRELRETHTFVASVYNHTLPPRDARAARYRFTLPAGLLGEDFPLTVSATLVHRARSAAMEAAACEDAQAQRGLAFAQWSARVGGGAIDGCVAAPEVTVAKAALQLGPGARAAPSATPAWERAVRHALALSVGLQERLDEARPSLTRAEREARGQPGWARARVAWAQGLVASKQGRLDEALASLARAQAALGAPSAAIERTRGDAYAQVWRWTEAAAAYARAELLAPRDLDVARALAQAEASAGRPARALAAAQRGLALHPRDPDCLRVQALALEQLGAPEAQVREATEAALHWRPADDAPAARGKCSKNVDGCAARRNPVPEYPLLPPLAPIVSR